MGQEIVILGGGFGGFYAARQLERALPHHSARVTLISEDNFLLYTPLLPGAAGGTLEPRHVVVPLREELSRTQVRLGSVIGGDPDGQTVRVRLLAGQVEDIAYDQLIVALGSVSRTLPVPGLAEYGVGFKGLPDAIALRNNLIVGLEAAEAINNAETRAPWLTHVFVGAGYAGLEGLAELQDFAADLLDLYPRCRQQGMRWILVEARDRVMPEIPSSLADFATRELRGRGIEIRLSTTLEEITEEAVRLSDGEIVPTRSVVWTAGVRPSPVIAQLGLPLSETGRIAVEKTMQVSGRPSVWAIGDSAAVPDPARKGQPCPPTAQHALRQGRLVGRNVAAVLGSGKVRPFKYRTRGVFVDMGRGKAVASTLGLRWRGTPAWWLTRTYHVAMMPGVKRRLRLLVDWNVGLLFGRDASELGRLGHPAGLADRADEGTGMPVSSPAGDPPAPVPILKDE